MVDKKVADKKVVEKSTEKKITVGLDIRGKNFNHKAKHAMTAFKVQLKKHFRNKECIVSPGINLFIWGKGRVNAPSKVSFTSVEKNGKVYLFLDTKEDQIKKEEFVSGKVSEVKKKVYPVKEPAVKKSTNKTAKAVKSNVEHKAQQAVKHNLEQKVEIKTDKPKEHVVEHKIEHKVEKKESKK